MISEFDAAKACLDKLKAFADTSGLRIAVNGSEFDPGVNEEYFKEYFLFNDNSGGQNANSSEVQQPIYQINPVIPKETSKFRLYQLCDLVKTEFARATKINDNITIENVSLSPVLTEEATKEIAISVNLTIHG